MIGLVLGETQFGNLIVKKLQSLKKDFIIIDVSKNKIFKKYKNSFSLSIGQLGKGIKILKQNKCKKIIFAGKVKKPNFTKTRFDIKALFYLPKIIKASKKGDAEILKLVLKIFRKEGFKILNSTFFNSELLLKKGNYTKTKPSHINKKDMAKGRNIVTDIKRFNVGQGVVIRKGHVVAIEGEDGTDAMLNRAGILIKKIVTRKKREAVLVKFPKKKQDLRIDLPTVGIKTIKKCVKIGIKGIFVKSNQNILLDKSKCINLANKNRMFICSI